MALAGFLSSGLGSLAAGLWNTVKPILGAAGRSIASSFATQGANKLTQIMADKGIQIQNQQIDNINNNLKRAKQNRKMMDNQFVTKRVSFRQQPQSQQQIYEQRIYRPILKRPKQNTQRKNAKFLRKR